MPLFLAIVALAFGSYWLGRGVAQRQLGARVGAVPQRPPAFYVGDRVFSLPQERWGVIECLACSPSGACRYGVRFPSGNAAVLREHEIVR